MASDSDSIKPPATTAGRRRRKIRLGSLISLAALAAAALTVGGVVVVRNLVTSCGDGVEHHGERDECVGLTDSSFVFREEYRHVAGLIRAENEYVRKQNSLYVTVVWLEPMTLTDPDSTDPVSVRHRLQGAYLAQHRANHPPQGQRQSLPLVRLLLANAGSQSAQWETVVDQIRDQRDEEHIVAVAGLGQSLEGTRKAINRLAQYNIPMVAGLITADSMSEPPGEKEVPGFIRVVPTNTAQVSALVQAVKDEVDTGLLVHDTSPNEVFPQDISRAFRRIFPQDGRKLLPVEEFDSSLGRTINDFPKMVLEICQEDPGIVFFAGRAVPLLEFLDALTDRHCVDQPVRVLTGDSASHLAANQHLSLDEFGNPRDKALTIVRVGPPSATPVYEVSAASGTPCTPDRPTC